MHPAAVFHLLFLILLHFIQLFIDGLEIGIERIVVVVWETVADGKSGIGRRADIKGVGIPVIPDMENISGWQAVT